MDMCLGGLFRKRVSRGSAFRQTEPAASLPATARSRTENVGAVQVRVQHQGLHQEATTLV
eukprot:1137995-Pelagomonas_calceolata.AAC.1